jgi:hypothetical protein
MKKVIVGIVALAMMVGLGGCTLNKEFNFYDFKMSDSKLEKTVKDWAFYTNGTWRYEVRLPNSWYVHKADEWDKEVYFVPKSKEADFNAGNYKGAIYVKGVMNFDTKYDATKYFESEGKKDLLSGNFQQLEVGVGGEKGILIKNVDTFYKMSVDELVVNLGDRILDVYIYEKTPETLAVLNSLTFYGNKIIDIK